jgi:hypothetical protein
MFTVALTKCYEFWQRKEIQTGGECGKGRGVRNSLKNIELKNLKENSGDVRVDDI